jgi:hypothetical protein
MKPPSIPLLLAGGGLHDDTVTDIGAPIMPRRRRRSPVVRKSSLSGKSLLLWTINALVWGAVAAWIWGIR